MKITTHHHKYKFWIPGHLTGTNPSENNKPKLPQQTCVNRSQQEVSRAHTPAIICNKTMSENPLDISDELTVKVMD
jgi:hypothetical protein